MSKSNKPTRYTKVAVGHLSDEVLSSCEYVKLGGSILAEISTLPQLELYPD